MRKGRKRLMTQPDLCAESPPNPPDDGDDDEAEAACRTPPPVAGQRYVSGERFRRVLAVSKTHVIYSRGGDAHYECQVKTLCRWLRARPRERRVTRDRLELRP